MNGLIIRPQRGLLSLIPILAAAGCWGWANSAKAEIVYDNLSLPLNQFFCDTREFGDEINLGTEATTLTKFQFEYYGAFQDDGTHTVQVRLYANDGEGSDTSVGVFGDPQTVLYDSGPLLITSGYNVVTLSGLSVPVTSRFTYTVKFGGVDGTVVNRAGLTMFNPPNVGSSYNDFWMLTPTGWSPFLFPSGVPYANFGARVEGTPETPLAITSQTVLENGAVQISVTGPVYSAADLETAVDTDTNQWFRLHTFFFQGQPLAWTDPTVEGATNRLYRVVTNTDPYLAISGPAITDHFGRLKITGSPGHSVIVEASEDWAQWDLVKTNFLVGAQKSFVDSSATTNHSSRFYRAWFAGPVPVSITSYNRLDNGMVVLAMSGPPGKDCLIKSSTDLVNWQVEATRTFSFTGGLINYLDPQAANASTKFYVAELVP